MKKKNGFTLIELLAVIVILAIIALIAVVGLLLATDGPVHSAFVNLIKTLFEKASMS